VLLITITAIGHGGIAPESAIGPNPTAGSIESAPSRIVDATTKITGRPWGAYHAHTGILDALSFHTPKSAVTANVFAGVVDTLPISADPGEGAAQP
jgi:hypothetical protein